MEIITKKQAKENGDTSYFTGEECKNGHVDKRYTSTGVCYSCKAKQARDCHKRNPETLKNRSKRSYQSHSKSNNERSKLWAENNKEKRKEILNRNKLKYKDKYRESAKLYQQIKRQDPSYRLSRNISKAIWECLKNNKAGKSWKKFVDFTIDELKIHLESKFKEGMTWDNYGSYWHIDHIKPLSWFDLKNEMSKAWSISNLQPLTSFENLSKNNKYEGSYRIK